jgi:AraC family transcriptional regulator of adaptative response/methylated-DNA-[protein]-cysteine methyltransferase
MLSQFFPAVIMQHFRYNYSYNDVMMIFYTIKQTYLGQALIAATQRGICAISFGDDDASLEADLRARYFGVTLEKDTPALASWASVILDYLETPSQGLDLPIDLQGTNFQRTVWQALREIPCGETVTYAQLAAQLGHPNAARAVALACATNTIAAVIPCHRVIGSNGSLTGYRWGIERKKLLLEREKNAYNGSRNTQGENG